MMMSSEFLRGHADALSRFAKETVDRARAAPDDFFLQLAAKNQEDSARAVEHQLLLDEAEEAGELFDLRLIGPQVNGCISLDWFIKAMEPLSKAWKLAAHRLRYGTDSSRAVGADVVSALNLKLAGIGHGSARIFVTGNARPDLTGESLLQATLVQIFRLLNSSQDDFYDAVDAIGGRSAHQLGEFMRRLDDAGLAAQFTWESPRGRQFWEGGPDEITRIRALLDTIREPERYEEVIQGRIAGIADTGRLEMRTDNGKLLVRFPLKLTEQVQRLTVTSMTSIRVETACYWDSVQKKDIRKRQFISVE
ncbi:MAG: hypothetical protein LBK55_11365 [Azoarcus sp.]|jgi:hypothetical protein|nr:hypothetical protein [Azoarcus sp.]